MADEQETQTRIDHEMRIQLPNSKFWKTEAAVLTILLGICLVFGSLLDRLDKTEFQNLQREKASQVGIETFQVINTVFSNMSLGLGRLVTAAELVPDMTAEEFETVVERMLQHFNSLDGENIDLEPAIVGIAIAPDLVVHHVYPLPRNKSVVGLDYRTLPDQLPDIELALQSENPLLSRPFQAVQGPRSISIRAAVRGQDGSAWGLATVTVDLDAMFGQLVERLNQNAVYQVAISIDDFGAFGDLEVFDHEPVVLSFQERRLNWSIAVAPNGGWLTLPLFTQTRVMTAVATLLVLAMAHFQYDRAMRARRVVARLKSGIDALSAGFLITDHEDRLVHWNETYPKLMNHGSDLRKGMPLEIILRNGVKRGTYRVPDGEVDEWIARLMEGHRKAETSFEVELADGRWIRTMSKRTPDGDVVGVRFDITDLKRAQLTAERMSRAKSEFISVLSHELRTPLTSILGFAKLLQAKSKTDEQPTFDSFSRDAVGRIIQAAEDELKMVNMMLEYAELTAEVRQVNVASFNLSDVIAAEVEKAQPKAEQRSVALSADVPPIWVLANRDQVSQIVEHLLSNALKFTSSGGLVAIRSDPSPAFAIISVADSGEGIAAENLNAIFEEFSQIQPSRIRRVGGAGLGLTLTKRLIELQGGTISVDSSLGQGTVVTFTIPRDVRANDDLPM